jgi:glycosyltransferase involved in cell wall biosynthesis
MRRRLLYFHDGKSLYDDFFLNFLKHRYDVVFSTFSRSGAERILRTAGVRVRLMSDLPLEMEQHDTVRRLALTPLRVPFFAAEVKAVDPDVVLACWATTYGFYASAARLESYALMVWASDLLVQTRYAPVRALAISAVKNARRVFADSEVVSNKAVSLGCPPSNVVKFPHIDLTSVLDLKVDKEETRRQLQVSDDEVLVMWNRRHDWVYAPEVYVRAASLVVKEEPRTIFLMAGQGRLTPSVQELVRKLGLERNFRLLGWVEKELLIRYTAASDIYVTTAISDGTSASLLESMALGIPVVVPGIPGNAEWVKQDEDGLVFPKGDYTALSREILELARSPSERARLGRAGREVTLSRADWKKGSELFLEGLEAASLRQ